MSKKLLTAALAITALFAGVWIASLLRVDFKTLDGQGYRWSSLQGDWVVVNYFAEWCAPCLKEVPELNAFNQQIATQNIRLFAVSWDDLSHKELTTIKQRYDMQFDLLALEPEPKMPFSKPSQLPVSYILSPQGQLVKTLKGEQTSETLLRHIAQLKNEV